MIAKRMRPYLENNSAIRTMFEEGTSLKAQYGEDNVFDFSIGNPNVPPPLSVSQAIHDLVDHTNP